MRAVGMSEFGGPDVLEVVDLPEPVPGEGEIRIRVAAATVNPADILFRSGALASYLTGPRPYVAGLELSGVVDAVGPGADVWRVGDEVAAMTAFIPEGRGAHAEKIVIHSDSAVPLPRGASLVEAATLAMNGITARQALDRLALTAGKTLLVTGAAGALGGYVLQLAALEGIRTIALAGDADATLVRSLGATDFASRARGVDGVRELCPDGVDAVVDAAQLGPAIVDAVRDGGQFVPGRGYDGEPPRDISVVRVTAATDVRERGKLQRLADLVEQGKLKLRVAGTFPPERAAEAHRKLEAGGVRGRLVLVFD